MKRRFTDPPPTSPRLTLSSSPTSSWSTNDNNNNANNTTHNNRDNINHHNVHNSISPSHFINSNHNNNYRDSTVSNNTTTAPNTNSTPIQQQKFTINGENVEPQQQQQTSPPYTFSPQPSPLSSSPPMPTLPQMKRFKSSSDDLPSMQFLTHKNFNNNNNNNNIQNNNTNNNSQNNVIKTLNDLDHSLINHILLFIPDQRHLLFTCSRINRKFASCILQSPHNHQNNTNNCTTTSIWSTSTNSSTTTSAAVRPFVYGWYGTKQLRTSIDELVIHHGMTHVELCDIVLDHGTLTRLMHHGTSVTSLKLFRVKYNNNQNNNNNNNQNNLHFHHESENDSRMMMKLQSLSIEYCNEIATNIIRQLILHCCCRYASIHSISLKDSSCVTDDIIDAFLMVQNNNNNHNNMYNDDDDDDDEMCCSSTKLKKNMMIEKIELKNLKHVSHGSVCCLLKQCAPYLRHLSIENCHAVSEWKLMECLTSVEQQYNNNNDNNSGNSSMTMTMDMISHSAESGDIEENHEMNGVSQQMLPPVVRYDGNHSPPPLLPSSPLRYLRLVGFDYDRRRALSHHHSIASSSSSSNRVTSGGDGQNDGGGDPIRMEHVSIMQQLVQQTLSAPIQSIVSFRSLQHLILQGNSDQFTSIALNRLVHGMDRSQLQTLKLSTNAFDVMTSAMNHKTTTTTTTTATANNTAATNSGGGGGVNPQMNGPSSESGSSCSNASAPRKPFLIQKELYSGLLGLKKLDIHMGTLHPSFVTNLLHACCSQVTELNMSYGTFFNKGLKLFTTVAKNVQRLSLSDCSFESSDWLSIISYHLPNLRQLSVSRVHVKLQKVTPPLSSLSSEDATATSADSKANPQQSSVVRNSDLTYTRRVTNIQKLRFDSLYSLVGVNEMLSTTICDLSEVGRLVKLSPKLDMLDFHNMSKWELVNWLSANLGHIEKHTGLTLKVKLKAIVSADPIQDMIFIPKLHMFPPSVHTLDVQLDSNGFNSHLLLALSCQNIQGKTNIILSDQCERELVAISEYYYSHDNFTYYPTVRQRMEDIVIKQTKERISDLIMHGIQGMEVEQKQALIQRYLQMNSYQEFVACPHLSLLLKSCVDFLVENEHGDHLSDDHEYSVSGSIFTYDEAEGDRQSEDSGSSCCVM